MRGIRFALEYEKAELALRDRGVASTVIVFGSARASSPEQAAAVVAARPDEDHAAAAGLAEHGKRCEMARRFGRLVSERGGVLNPTGGQRRNVIATGGGPGVMEAANRDAADVGAPSIGFDIALPREQAPNPYATPALTFRFHYFAMRKMHLAMRARALAVFPGGFGAFDELFEILTLQQTHKGHRASVVLVDSAFWRRTIDFEGLVADGMIDRAELDLFGFADDAEEAWRYLVDRGLLESPSGR